MQKQNNVVDRLMMLYGDKVQNGEKAIDELVGFLRSKGCIEQSPQLEIEPFRLGDLIFNIKRFEFGESYDEKRFAEHIKFPERFMNDDRINLAVYKFPKCDENLMFYSDYQLDGSAPENFIYVIFETNTKYIWSNCIKLKTELKMKKGITKEEVDKRGDKLFDYLANIDLYMRLCN